MQRYWDRTFNIRDDFLDTKKPGSLLPTGFFRNPI